MGPTPEPGGVGSTPAPGGAGWGEAWFWVELVGSMRRKQSEVGVVTQLTKALEPKWLRYHIKKSTFFSHKKSKKINRDATL